MEKRTLTQNAAMHKFFELLAEDLNAAGLDMRHTLKPEVEIPWTPATVKTHLWRPIQDAMLEKESTTELTTKEVNQVYEVLIRHMGEKFNITTAFPSEEK
jgi:hypothetical protein